MGEGGVELVDTCVKSLRAPVGVGALVMLEAELLVVFAVGEKLIGRSVGAHVLSAGKKEEAKMGG